MRIALLGYGKMGKAIESIALDRHHEISWRIGLENLEDAAQISPENTDVVIEFTQPDAALTNIKTYLHKGLPIVCGTTGWLAHLPEVRAWVAEANGAFFYASNFSIGVNLFFRLNEYAAQLMQSYTDIYHISLEETHHTEKKDAPSGTAITLAEGILANMPHLTQWVNTSAQQTNELSIISHREPNVPGTHLVNYKSAIDDITLTHVAHNRTGFATGAVVAAEWLAGRKGVFTMRDLLGI